MGLSIQKPGRSESINISSQDLDTLEFLNISLSNLN